MREALQFVQALSSKYLRQVLREREVQLTPEALNELALVTALMKLIAHPRHAVLHQEILGFTALRFQTQLLALLSLFTTMESWRSRGDYAAHSKLEQLQMQKAANEIVFNILSYTRMRMDNPPNAGLNRRRFPQPMRPLFRASVRQSSEDAPGLVLLLRHLNNQFASYNVSTAGLAVCLLLADTEESSRSRWLTFSLLFFAWRTSPAFGG